MKNQKNADIDCTAFLQWCLPEMQFRWKGFKHVRGQVCKRIKCRMKELDLSGYKEYQLYLENHPPEWERLSFACRVTISRFYRDRRLFQLLENEILPVLAANEKEQNGSDIRCWSAGCCSGEEPYALQIIWQLAVQPSIEKNLSLKITATDIDPLLLQRAAVGVFSAGSLKELPDHYLGQAFERVGDKFKIKNRFRNHIKFMEQNIRHQLPDENFHLILCRNLVFTYFCEDLQRELLVKFLEHLKAGGFLIIGSREQLPPGIDDLNPYRRNKHIYQKVNLRNNNSC